TVRLRGPRGPGDGPARSNAMDPGRPPGPEPGWVRMLRERPTSATGASQGRGNVVDVQDLDVVSARVLRVRHAQLHLAVTGLSRQRCGPNRLRATRLSDRERGAALAPRDGRIRQAQDCRELGVTLEGRVPAPRRRQVLPARCVLPHLAA